MNKIITYEQNRGRYSRAAMNNPKYSQPAYQVLDPQKQLHFSSYYPSSQSGDRTPLIIAEHCLLS